MAAGWCFIAPPCYVTARRQGQPWGLEVNTGRRWNAVENTCYEAATTTRVQNVLSFPDFELRKLLVLSSANTWIFFVTLTLFVIPVL